MREPNGTVGKNRAGPRVILCHDMMGNYLVDAAHQADLSAFVARV